MTGLLDDLMTGLSVLSAFWAVPVGLLLIVAVVVATHLTLGRTEK